jgi:hypothetical protein
VGAPGLRKVAGLGICIISGEVLFRDLVADVGAGLDLGVGSIAVDESVPDARGVAADVRGLLRIRMAEGSGTGVKKELTSGLTGGGDGEGGRE